MTATERLFRSGKEEYLSMDDEDNYGKTIYNLSFKDAIYSDRNNLRLQGNNISSE